MSDNTPSGSGPPAPQPAPQPAPPPAPPPPPAPAAEQAPSPAPGKSPAAGQEQRSVHEIARDATQRAIADLNRVDSRGRTPSEAATAAQTRAEARIDDVAARLVKGANEYAANVAARSTANRYAGDSVRSWSEYQMGFSSSDAGTGRGAEQAQGAQASGAAGLDANKGMTASKTHPTPNPSATPAPGAAGQDVDKGVTRAKTNPTAARPSTEAAPAQAPTPEARAVRSASAGLGSARRREPAKSTLSSPKARETRAAQKSAYQSSVQVPNAPSRTGAAKNTLSAPRGRAERAGQQVFRGLRKLFGKGT